MMYGIDPSVAMATVCFLLFAVVLASHHFSRHGRALVLASASVCGILIVGVCAILLLSI